MSRIAMAAAILAIATEARAEPARLIVEAPTEATIHVDGKDAARAPQDAPLELAPGEHFIAVTLDGHHPHGQTIDLARGKTTTLVVDLDATGQRIGAGVLLGVGAGGIAAGIALGVMAVVKHREAQDAFEDVDSFGPSPDEVATYEDAIAARDDFRLGSGVAGGLGLGLFVLGGALFVLDSPETPTASTLSVGRGPGLAGLSLRLGF